MLIEVEGFSVNRCTFVERLTVTIGSFNGIVIFLSESLTGWYIQYLSIQRGETRLLGGVLNRNLRILESLGTCLKVFHLCECKHQNCCLLNFTLRMLCDQNNSTDLYLSLSRCG